MRFGIVVAAILFGAGTAFAKGSEPYEHYDLLVGGKPWLSTVFTPYDPAYRMATYKVFTHILDFEGKAPITNGIHGKKFPHHRGMFIGWKKTRVHGREYNFWEMSNKSTGDVTQRHVAWLEQKPGATFSVQKERINWCGPKGQPFIEETRTISAKPGPNGVRLIDFGSSLVSVAGPIELRGDLQHAGMQVRMADEVSRHEATTRYILPPGVVENVKINEVKGAWWVCCSAVVRDKRYWVMHMTPKTLSTGQPVYSIRRYGRFGAFFEPNLVAGQPFQCHFRIVVSDHALDQAACGKLYQEYEASGFH